MPNLSSLVAPYLDIMITSGPPGNDKVMVTPGDIVTTSDCVGKSQFSPPSPHSGSGHLLTVLTWFIWWFYRKWVSFWAHHLLPTHDMSQWTHNVLITSLVTSKWRSTSFWRNNDVNIASCVRWDMVHVGPYKLSCQSRIFTGLQNGRPVLMMTSSNGNIFRVTGHLCREFAGHRELIRR